MVMVSTSISVLTWNNHIASEHLQDFLWVSFFPQEHGRFFTHHKTLWTKNGTNNPPSTNDSRGGGFDGYFAGRFGGVFFHPSTWWHFFCWWINIGFTYLQECGGLEIAINHRNYTVIDFSEIEWGFFHTIFFFFFGGDGYMELFCWRVFPGWWHGQSILRDICRYDICNLLRYDC